MIKIFAALVSCLSVYAASGKNIVWGLNARIGSLDPYLVSGIDSYNVTGLIFEPLARIEASTGQLQPWLASEWSIDKNANIVKVKLRKGVQFHNGEPLTCEDVEFTFNSYSNSKFKGDVWRAMWADVKRIDAVDKTKCEIHFSNLTYQGFRNVMTALRILPRNPYAQSSAELRRKSAIGTGSFRIARFIENQRLWLKPNPDWWGGSQVGVNSVSGLLIRPVGEPILAAQMMQKGELDIYEVPAGHPLNGAGIKKIPSHFGRGFGLTVNFRNSKLSDQNVRRALLALWNRKNLNTKLFAGALSVSLDSFSPNRTYYPNASPQEFNLREARSLFKRSGYKDADQNGFLDGLEFKVLARSHESERWLGLFQADAATAGVKIKIERIDDEAQWWKLIQEGKFDLLANDGPLSEAPHKPVYHSKGAYNTSGLKDKKVDQLFDRLDEEFSEVRRAEIYRELIEVLRDLMVEVPGLHSMESHYLTSPKVRLDPKHPEEPWRWSLKGP